MSANETELTDHDWMLAWVNLMHAGAMLLAGLEAKFRDELGIGVAEQDVIKQLAVNGGQIKLSELASYLWMSKAGMTKMIDRLERDGLVERVRSTKDRRVVSAVLTPAGGELFRRSRKVLESWVEKNFRRHLTDAEIVAVRDSLRSLIEGWGRWEAQMKHLRGEPDDPGTSARIDPS